MYWHGLPPAQEKKAYSLAIAFKEALESTGKHSFLNFATDDTDIESTPRFFFI
jgi:hypothetical protein